MSLFCIQSKKINPNSSLINENFINDEFLWFVIQWGFDEKCLIIRHSNNGIQVIFVYVRARLFFNSHPSYFQERITRMVC